MMEKSKVIMVNNSNLKLNDSMMDRLEKLWYHDKVKLNDWINEGDIVIIKTHFGSRNQTRHLRPMYIRKIVDFIRKEGGIPWVAEGVGLGWDYKNAENAMANGPGFMTLANRHGFNFGSMLAPIVMLDGVAGTDTYTADNEKGKYLKKIAVQMGLKFANKVLVVSHFKGHDGIGFGGALKQLGIGMVGVAGKGAAHFGGSENIYVKEVENCDGCGKCITMCPRNCLSLDKNNKIIHDPSNCIACIHCFAACHDGKDIKTQRVFALRRQIPSVEQSERMMDNAGGVASSLGCDKLRYINIAADITSHCDCMSVGDNPIVPDQGILFSNDPIAIDQACVDLVTKSPGIPGSPLEKGIPDSPHGPIEPVPGAMDAHFQKFGIYSRFTNPESRPNIASVQLNHALKLGLGSKDYELIDITEDKRN